MPDPFNPQASYNPAYQGLDVEALRAIQQYGPVYRAQPGLRGPAGSPAWFGNSPFAANLQGPGGQAFMFGAADEERQRAQQTAPASPRQPDLNEMNGQQGLVPYPEAPPAPPSAQPSPPPASPGVLAQEAPPAAPAGVLATPAQAPATPMPQAAPQAPVAPPQAPQGQPGVGFEDRLGQRESGDRWDAQNREGYTGRYQFGADRLADIGVYTPAQGERGNQWGGTFNIPGFPQVRNVQDFRANPDAQRAAFQLHQSRIDAAIDATPGAESMNRDGLRGVAHLGGEAGMRRFVATGGQYDPADSNGTSLSNYYRQFAGSDTPPGRPPAAAPGGQAQIADRGVAAETTSAATSPPPAPSADPYAGLDQMLAQPPRSSNLVDPKWLALAGGFFSGKTPMESFANASGALGRQQNTDVARDDRNRTQAQSLAVRRAEARATLAQQGTQNRLAQDRLDIDRRRVDAYEAGISGREGARGATVQSTTPVIDPNTRQTYSRQTMRDGTVRLVDNNNQPAPPEVATRVLQGQHSADVAGDLATARGAGTAAGRDSVAEEKDISDDNRAATTRMQETATMRDLIRREGVVGPDALSRVQRFIVGATGLPVGTMTPSGLSLTQTMVGHVTMDQGRNMFQGQGAVSNYERQLAANAVLSMQTNPQAAEVLMDIQDRADRRAVATQAAWNEMSAAEKRAIRSSGGVRAWRDQQFQRMFEAEGFNASPGATGQALAAPTPSGDGWRSTTSGTRFRVVQ